MRAGFGHESREKAAGKSCPAGLSSDLYPPRSIEGKTRTKLCQKGPQGTGLRASPELRPV